MEKVGVDLINNIDTDQFENYVLCLQEMGPLSKNLNNEVRDLYCLNAQNGVGFKGLLEIVKYLKRHRIQVVHTNNPAPHLWGSLAAKLCGIRSLVHSVHGRGFIRYKKGAMIEKFASKMSKSIVCVSEDAAEQRRLIGIPGDKISVISNGVDTDIFYDQAPPQTLIKEFNLQEKIVIGSVARFSVDKDQETLIKAFQPVVDQYANVTLLLVGDGETKEKCEELARTLKLESRVVFTGARSDVLDLLRAMDVYVLATHTEGLSISLLEAMSSQRPVIATAVGGNVEVIDDRINGILVAESDKQDLTDAIKKLLDSGDERAQLAKSARKTVLERYSMRAMVEQYQSLYLKHLA